MSISYQKRDNNGHKSLKDPKVFIEYSNSMQDVYKKIEEYHLHKVLLTISYHLFQFLMG